MSVLIGRVRGRAILGAAMSNSIRAMAVAALLAAALILGGTTSMAADSDKTNERSITVSAIGSVPAEPDLAYITAGVASEADTAREALNRNSTLMTKVIDGLKAAGIAAKDIQTSAVNVEPRYTQPKDNRAATISGYRVSNQVRLTVRDIKKLGDVLDQAISLGANQVSGIAFAVSNAETLKDEARKQAIQNARRRAELFAAAAGAQLGPVLRIAEEVSAARPMPGARALAASVPIEPGTRTLDAEVHVTWALR
jgi:uncharacterized protein